MPHDLSDNFIYILKKFFIWGAKYQTRKNTAAVTNTGIAISGLVRNVILAIAKRKRTTRSFTKAKSQLSKEYMILFELNKRFLGKGGRCLLKIGNVYFSCP